MYGVTEYLMSLQEVVKTRLDRQKVQEVDQRVGSCEPLPDQEWVTKEE